MSVFRGLSAYPITPTDAHGTLDRAAFARVLEPIVAAGVDSIGVLGSTGAYLYLNGDERAVVVAEAVTTAGSAAGSAAGSIPVVAGIGALRTDDVLRNAERAQTAGAAGVLLAPVSYTPLTEDEVFGLYEDVTAELSVPLCVYDNPSTTHFTFTRELLGRIARLPNIAGVKSGVPVGVSAEAWATELRAVLPAGSSLGVSGDWNAADALAAGADVWHSVLGGTLPSIALDVVRRARADDVVGARAASESLEPLWVLFRAYGSIRVVSAAATILGRTTAVLPRPIKPIPKSAIDELAGILSRIESSAR